MSADPWQFSIDATPLPDDGVRVVVAGEVDVATSGRLGDALHGEISAHHAILLDLADVTFIDSTGIRALLSGLAEARDHGLDFAVDPRLSIEVERALSLTGVLPSLPFAEV
jgi:anti-anti-sigma factor